MQYVAYLVDIVHTKDNENRPDSRVISDADNRLELYINTAQVWAGGAPCLVGRPHGSGGREYITLLPLVSTMRLLSTVGTAGVIDGNRAMIEIVQAEHIPTHRTLIHIWMERRTNWE